MGAVLRGFLTAIIGLCTLAAAPAYAEELPADFAKRKGVIKLAPSAPWNIDFADNKCVLSRLFGSTKDPHLVAIEQAAPQANFGMTLAGRGTKRFAPGRWNYIGILGDVPMLHLRGVQRGKVDHIGPAIIFSTVQINPLPVEDDELNEEAKEEAPKDNTAETERQSITAGINLDQAQKIDRIILKLGTSGLSFETGNMKAAMQALNVCTNDLLQKWGLDAEKHKIYTPPQWINLDEVVALMQDTYPRAAIYRGEQAIFRMRLIVESDGSVSDCLLEETTVTDRLKSKACEVMQIARFNPALDSAGQPMRSFHAQPISYIM